MLAHADPSQVAGLSRFFKTGPGQYGEGDMFLGIKVPVTRAVVKACWRETDFEALEECIRSGYHEVRLAALLTLVQIFVHARKDAALQQRCVAFYLGHMEFVNNWDLVDLSCYEILGRWLLGCRPGNGRDSGGDRGSSAAGGLCGPGVGDTMFPRDRGILYDHADGDIPRDRRILYDLARNGRTIWEQRIGIVSTMQFIRHGELDDTYAIAEIFLDKPQPIHDLLQKAVGWLLRDAGKRDPDRLRRWLAVNRLRMPRTMLRYSIEKFPEDERQALMA